MIWPYDSEGSLGLPSRAAHLSITLGGTSTLYSRPVKCSTTSTNGKAMNTNVNVFDLAQWNRTRVYLSNLETRKRILQKGREKTYRFIKNLQTVHPIVKNGGERGSSCRQLRTVDCHDRTSDGQWISYCLSEVPYHHVCVSAQIFQLTLKNIKKISIVRQHHYVGMSSQRRCQNSSALAWVENDHWSPFVASWEKHFNTMSQKSMTRRPCHTMNADVGQALCKSLFWQQ